MKLNEVMEMIRRSGRSHIVKIVDGNLSELVTFEDWDSGACLFDGELWVRAINDGTLLTIVCW